MAAAMPELDDELRHGVCQVLTHVWFSSLIGWVNGWGGGVDVAAEVEVAARLLFR
jgi:TetR/AcrR family transcriptional regulator, cholesterol catabolism regulator